MTALILADIGAKALYLLLVWLASATAASYLSERKGYGDKLGLASGPDHLDLRPAPRELRLDGQGRLRQPPQGRPRPLMRRAIALAAVGTVVTGLALARDGGPAVSRAQAPARVVQVYSSLPLQGASRDQTAAVVRGIRIALAEAGGRAGDVEVRYASLDDSTARAGNWDPSATARNARRAALDERTVLYIGEFNSGASAISIPILNQAGITQVSPSNTYIGLTARGPGTESGEPGIYYPTGKRTYIRLPPNDTVQGAALVTLMREDGCRRAALVEDGDDYGASVGGAVTAAARHQGLRLVLHGRRATARRAAAVARAAATAKTDCFLFSGVTANGADTILEAVARRVPRARLYGGDGICESGLTRALPVAVRQRFRCTVAARDLRDYPGGAAFAAAYAAAYGTPDPYAIYGYEAMKLGLDTIGGLPADWTRADLTAAMFATRDRASVLGTYSVQASGDLTLRDYGVFRALRDGSIVYLRKVVAGP
jgi:branched-chain amino acid transport system substrate-binding protein